MTFPGHIDGFIVIAYILGGIRYFHWLCFACLKRGFSGRTHGVKKTTGIAGRLISDHDDVIYWHIRETRTAVELGNAPRS
jgi:hypothetical protein